MTMKIYSRPDKNVAYIEGVTECFTGACTPTASGDLISIYHNGLGQYEVKDIPYTAICDQYGNTFASASACLAYLQGVFSVQLNAFYTFNQSSPLTVWVINHNLGYYPSCTVYSTGNVEIDCDIINVTQNQTRLTFNVPTAGYAKLY